MSHVIKLTVTIELERESGKFASRDEMTEALIEEMQNAQPTELYGLGADGESTYSVSSFEVVEA